MSSIIDIDPASNERILQFERDLQRITNELVTELPGVVGAAAVTVSLEVAPNKPVTVNIVSQSVSPSRKKVGVAPPRVGIEAASDEPLSVGSTKK